jgi:Carboxypeptidase regulatory-like domain
MRFIAVSFAAAFSACALLAQTTNNQSILGTVQDSSGAVVPNATVTVVSEATNLTRSATSNESGNYVISNLPIGLYGVSATAQGFKNLHSRPLQQR